VLSPDLSLLAHMRRANFLILPDTERALLYIGDRRRRCLPKTAEGPPHPRKTYAAGLPAFRITCRFCAIYRRDQPILP
jgi:hypothetical protein